MGQESAAPYADLLPEAGSTLRAIREAVSRQGRATHPAMADSLEQRLQATLNLIPAHAWYATPSGALLFVNERTAEYLGLASDHPLRFGIDTGASWDSHVALLHPDDREETRQVWSTCLKTGSAGHLTFRVRGAAAGYRWFISCASEPPRMRTMATGSLLDRHQCLWT